MLEGSFHVPEISVSNTTGDICETQVFLLHELDRPADPSITEPFGVSNADSRSEVARKVFLTKAGYSRGIAQANVCTERGFNERSDSPELRIVLECDLIVIQARSHDSGHRDSTRWDKATAFQVGC